MDFLKFSLAGLDDFAIYAALSIAFVYVYLIVYMRLTPYDELKLIKEGNSAAALSLGGSLLGFTFPLAATIQHSVNVVDMLIWALIALVVQLVVYVLVRRTLINVSRRIPEGQVASGIVLAAVSISAGLLNAACMTY